MTSYDASIKTPFAHIALVLEDDVLVSLDYISQGRNEIKPHSAVAKKIVGQLKAYFKNSGKSEFSVPLFASGTVFQKKVWRALQKIPCGKVVSYGEIATKLKTSPRAVGNACRRNPIPVIIPCHRVVSASGIGGYSGQTSGQLHDIKHKLLMHEGVSFEKVQ